MKNSSSIINSIILFITLIFGGIYYVIARYKKYTIIGLVLISILIILSIIKRIEKRKKYKNKNTTNQSIEDKINFNSVKEIKPKTYKKKQSLCTKYEYYFYNIIKKRISPEYIIIPQINLATIIEKISEQKFQNELYRNIDFGIFNKNTLEPLLLIEINDKTHNQPSKIKRDIKVKNICEEAEIKLIKFYSDKPNKPDYIISRINKELAN